MFKDATALSPLIAEAQNLCEDLYVLVGVNPKRVLLFENIQKEIDDCSESFSDIQRLKNLSRTRWTTRGSAAAVLINSFASQASFIDRTRSTAEKFHIFGSVHAMKTEIPPFDSDIKDSTNSSL
jgi:hypothetical protein